MKKKQMLNHLVTLTEGAIMVMMLLMVSMLVFALAGDHYVAALFVTIGMLVGMSWYAVNALASKRYSITDDDWDELLDDE